jgi:tetratricopeptide (TPR) repeat protein
MRGAEKEFIDAQREAEALGQSDLLMQVLNSRGIIASHQNTPKEEEDFYRRSLAWAEELKDEDYRSKVLNNLALIVLEGGGLDETRQLFQANLDYHTAHQNLSNMANAMVNLATTAGRSGEWTKALGYNERALAIREKLGLKRHVAAAHL